MDQLPEKQYGKLVLEKERRPVAGSHMAEDFVETAVDSEEGKNDDLLTIVHLKRLVFSIDWEISNIVLGSFTKELNRLKKVWADNRIFLVYVQAMEKLVRYVYVEKGNAHPGSIKLLLHLYKNLEQLVIERDWGEEKRKDILREDVRRFLGLKEAIERGVVGNNLDDGEEKRSILSTAKEASSAIKLATTPAASSSPPAFPVSGAVADRVDIADPADVQAEKVGKEDGVLPPQETFVAREIALQGVEVDTEADDGFDEDELLLQDGELAPALSEFSLDHSFIESDPDIETSVSSFFEEDDDVEAIPAGLSLVAEEEEMENILEEGEAVVKDDFAFEESFVEASPVPGESEDVVEGIEQSFTQEVGQEDEIEEMSLSGLVLEQSDDILEEDEAIVEDDFTLEESFVEASPVSGESEDVIEDIKQSFTQEIGQEDEIEEMSISGLALEQSDDILEEDEAIVEDDFTFGESFVEASPVSGESEDVIEGIEQPFTQEIGQEDEIEEISSSGLVLEQSEDILEEDETLVEDDFTFGESFVEASPVSGESEDVIEEIEQPFTQEIGQEDEVEEISSSAAAQMLKQPEDLVAAPSSLTPAGSEALLVEYCEKFVAERDESLLTEIASLHDCLLEELEGRPLELHLLLLFTAVADVMIHRQGDDEALLLASIAKTLQQVLGEKDALVAQRLLLRESAAVLDWFSGLVE